MGRLTAQQHQLKRTGYCALVKERAQRGHAASTYQRMKPMNFSEQNNIVPDEAAGMHSTRARSLNRG